MSGIEETVVLLVIVALSTLAIERTAEYTVEWIYQSFNQTADPSSYSGGLWAYPSCQSAPEGVFATLTDALPSSMDCAATTAINCFEACPVMLKLVVY